MKMLRMTTEVTKLDKVKSNYIRGTLYAKVLLAQNIREYRLRWYCHIRRRVLLKTVQGFIANLRANLTEVD